MELIDGNRLVYLIKEHLGKEVLIGIKRPRTATTGPTTNPGAQSQ
jgi:restriction system protein